MKLRTLLISAAAALPLISYGTKQEPYNHSRICWDISTKQQIFDMGNYGRIITLQDGRLLAVAETYGTYSGITVTFSHDNGKSWGQKQVVAGNQPGLNSCVPDVIQLTDGTIIVGYNPRVTKDATPDQKYGIRCVRSTDNGETWSDPIFIYDAEHESTTGCWEPSFLEMPDGEIHCYYSDEAPYTGNNSDQNISVCRSYDKGLTWTEPEIVSYRQGCRDGMPSAVITDNNEIVVVVEDFGHRGRSGFRATTVRCKLTDNWKNCTVFGDSENRDMIFDDDSEGQDYVSCAPYMRKLPTGEIIYSWMGDWYDRKNCPMERYDVYIGLADKDGRHTGQYCQPFKNDTGSGALWNSVNLGHDNTLFVVSSIGGGVYAMTGEAITGLQANYGTPVIDGNFKKDDYTDPDAKQIVLGQFFRNRSSHDFLYDDNYLYYTAYVADPTLTTDKEVNDGVQLSIDTKNLCDDQPQEGIYTFFLGADGKLEYAYGKDNEYHSAEIEGYKYVVKKGKTYYMFEAAIPWSVMGLDKAPVGQEMRVNISVRDMRPSGYAFEPIPDAQLYSSYTWPGFILNEQASIDGIGADSDNGDIDSSLPVEYYTLQGQRVSNPGQGLYIRRQGSKADKVLLKL